MLKGKCVLGLIGHILVAIGAINWGLVGIGNFLGINLNVVNIVLGGVSWLENVVYILVGVSAILMVIGCKCNKCNTGVPVSQV